MGLSIVNPAADAALAARYRALDPCSMETAAKTLGVGLKGLDNALVRTGTPRHAPNLRRNPSQTYADLAAAYRELPSMALTLAAEKLGTSRRTLGTALARTGTPVNQPRLVPVNPDGIARPSGWEPLPAGHPVTWGLLMALTPSLAGDP